MKTINKTAIVLVATGVIGLGAIGATVIPAMAKHHGEYHGKNYGDKQAKFAEMDTNGDGAVSLDELTAVATAKIQDRIQKRFAKMDANGDGQITEDELKSGKRKGKKGKRHHNK